LAEIVITEFMDAAAVARLGERFAVLYDPELVDQPAALEAALLEARALIVRNRTQVRDAVLEAAPKLEVVGRLGVGLDNIDLEACRARGVEVYPATGANDLAVAEYVMTTAALLLRAAYDARAAMLAGEWPRNRLIGRELSGKVMGLVGLGSIAREVATRAESLGMSVAAYDPYLKPQERAWDGRRQLDLDELFKEADILSLHVPLNDETRCLVTAERLALMKRGAVLVNAARGGIVDEAALAEALKAGRIAGAALDVFETEPLTREAATKFGGIANLVLTPHIAGVTEESNVRVSALIAGKVEEALTRSGAG